MLSASTKNNMTTIKERNERYSNRKYFSLDLGSSLANFRSGIILVWIKIFLHVKDQKVTEFYLFYSAVMNRAYSVALGEQQLNLQNEI